MPNNLTDDPSSYPANVQVPAAGDPRNDTSVATPFQQVANRTSNTKSRLDAIAPSSAVGYSPALPAGVTLGSVSLIATSVAALQSIPVGNRFDGMSCFVKDFGEYAFDAISTATPVTNIIVQPADLPASGRWFFKAYGLLGAPNGIVQADSASRVPAATVRNGIVGVAGTFAVATSITSTTPVDLFGGGATIAGLAIGDIVLVWGSASFNPAPGVGASLQVTAVLPSTSTTIVGSAISVSAAASPPAGFVMPTTNAFCYGVAYTVSAAGTHTFKLQAFVSSSNATVGGTLNLLAVRP